MPCVKESAHAPLRAPPRPDRAPVHPAMLPLRYAPHTAPTARTMSLQMHRLAAATRAGGTAHRMPTEGSLTGKPIALRVFRVGCSHAPTPRPPGRSVRSVSSATAVRRTPRALPRPARQAHAIHYASALTHTPLRASLVSSSSNPSRILTAIPLQSLRFASSTPSDKSDPSTAVVDPSKSSTTTTTATTTTEKDAKSQLPFRQRAWATIKKEAAHYWAGTKLLGKEIKISSKITWKVLNGGQLTRRERRQVSPLSSIVSV